MCEPTTIIMAVSAVVGALGAYQGAESQKAAATYQSQVAANNAKVSEWQAQDALQRGQVARQDTRRKYAALEGTQRAGLAARGLDISEGSALSILEDTQYFGELDMGTVSNNAAREAWGYRVQASNQTANASMLKAQADATNPMFAAGASLLSSGGSVARQWYGTKG